MLSNGDMHVLGKHIRSSTKTLGIYTFIALILLAVLIWCIVSIVGIVQFWHTQRKSFRETSTIRNGNNPNNPAHDNVAYINNADKLAEQDDDYQRYTDQISKSVSEFKDYNEKLKAFYDSSKPGEEPKDMIDETIIVKDNDNY